MTLLDGKLVSAQVLSGLKGRVNALRVKGIMPKLVAFNAGDHKPSKVYLAKKEKKAKEIGIDFELIDFPIGTTADTIIEDIKRINNSDASGIIFQLPLPDYLKGDTDKILDTIQPEKDVDLLTAENRQRLSKGEPRFVPPTAGAVMKILDVYNIDLARQKIILIGRGELVGKPLGVLLKMRDLEFTIIHRGTENVDEAIRAGTLIITAAGRPGLIHKGNISKGVIIVDAGTAESEGRVVGDVNPNVVEVASFLTPVPGGVGPVTVSMLLSNVVEAAERGSGLT